MKNVIFAAVTFAAGCVVGYFLGRKSNEKEFEDLLTKEIEDFKEAYRESHKEDSDISEPESEGHITNDPISGPESEGQVTNDPISNYRNLVTDLGYGHANIEDDEDEDWPYMIPPDEYGDCEGYSCLNMTYFKGDNVLIDNDNQVIDDPCKYIMEDFADHFGDYEDDAIHVRNDKLKCDIEVLLDVRRFSDVMAMI